MLLLFTLANKAHSDYERGHLMASLCLHTRINTQLKRSNKQCYIYCGVFFDESSDIPNQIFPKHLTETLLVWMFSLETCLQFGALNVLLTEDSLK